MYFRVNEHAKQRATNELKLIQTQVDSQNKVQCLRVEQDQKIEARRASRMEEQSSADYKVLQKINLLLKTLCKYECHCLVLLVTLDCIHGKKNCY